MLSGNLISSGVPIFDSYALAKKIIDKVPEQGLLQKEMFALTVNELPQENKKNYVLVELAKRYFVSKKSSNPFFILIGGMGGKSTATSYLTQHLNITSVIDLDEEKRVLRSKFPDREHLYKATYESEETYLKIVESLLPSIVEKFTHNIHDYTYHKKWSYIWEGIYITPSLLSEIPKKYPSTQFLNVFFMTPLEEVKSRYMYRWYSEFGADAFTKEKEKIDSYLKNIENIYTYLLKEAEHSSIKIHIIDDILVEDQLKHFYSILQKKLEEISESMYAGWVEKIVLNPTEITKFNDFLLND
jgi:2-phosphoglycerate kinase